MLATKSLAFRDGKEAKRPEITKRLLFCELNADKDGKKRPKDGS